MARSRRRTTQLGREPSSLGGEERRHILRSARQALQPEIAPPPPATRTSRRRHPVLLLLNGVLTFVLILLLAAGGLYYYGFFLYRAPGPLQAAEAVMIERGMGVSQIADLLKEKEVIDNRLLFHAGVRLSQNNAQLKAGEYLFEEQISMADVITRLVEGKSILHSITIPEGRTSRQIVNILMADPVLVGEIETTPPEGTLLPETYKFTRGDTRAQILQRMRSERDKVLADVWARRSADLPINTPEEMVILASIIEKETGIADERPRVAAVFINRLKRGMRLQSDPTVIYGLVGGEGVLGRPITQADLRSQTPYNTYVITGLPEGPIANPGRAALEAAVNPARTDELFFVANGSGGHAFARTYEAHQRNVRRWREFERQQRANDASDDGASTLQ